MCSVCDANRGLLRKARSPKVEQVVQTTLEEFRGVLERWHRSIVSALQSLGVDLSTSGAVRMAVEQTLSEVREEWVVTIEDAWEDGAEAGRAAAIQRHSLAISWEITDEPTRQAFREHGKRAAKHVQQRMVGDISDAVTDAYNEGIGPDRIADTLQEDVFPDMRGYEAKRVARTEGVSAGNNGRLTSLRDAGAPRKQWMARDDPKTRPTHVDADNQVVGIDEPFRVGGFEAQFPGDPRLPIGERINCRCILLPDFD